MFSYSPRIHHFIVPVLMFVAGQIALPTSWMIFGVAMYALGVVVAFLIGYAIASEIKFRRSLDEYKPDQVIDESHARPRDDEPQSVRVDLYETPMQSKHFDLPGSWRQLEQLATGLIIAGDPFTQRRWTGKGRPFSINQFNALRDEMLQKEYCYQINDEDPRQGYDLTLSGKAIMLRFIPSPTLKSLQPLQGTE